MTIVKTSPAQNIPQSQCDLSCDQGPLLGYPRPRCRLLLWAVGFLHILQSWGPT